MSGSDVLASAALASLVAEYAQRASAYGDALNGGDADLANEAHERLTRIYRELRQRGVAAQQELLALLASPNPGVRCWAAVHALDFAPAKGEQVLRQLAAEDPGPISLTAEILLSEWRKGLLRF